MDQQDDLLWVLAGYGGDPWTQMLPAKEARLMRLGIWWRQHQGSAPTVVDMINPRLAVIDDRVLVFDDYGDVVMAMASDVPSKPAPLENPAAATDEMSGKS